jgi:hypothetical protein
MPPQRPARPQERDATLQVIGQLVMRRGRVLAFVEPSAGVRSSGA